MGRHLVNEVGKRSGQQVRMLEVPQMPCVRDDAQLGSGDPTG
jgi:hypothetical protein